MCLALGKSKTELLNNMDAEELNEWLLYYQAEPFGLVGENILAGVISATIANVNRTKTTDKVYSFGDFMVYGDYKNGSTPKELVKTDTTEVLVKKVNILKSIFGNKK